MGQAEDTRHQHKNKMLALLMANGRRKSMSEGNLSEFQKLFPDERSAVAKLMALRWKDGEFCPLCGHKKIYHFSDGVTFKCAKCRKRFSIKVGTIFEDSKIPLVKWFAAIWLATKKPVTSAGLARDLGISQKSAWFLRDKLRKAADTQSFKEKRMVTVGVDNTWDFFLKFKTDANFRSDINRSL